MSIGLRGLLLTALLALASLTSHAKGTLIKVPSRPDVKTTLFWEPVAGAKATVFLFPGGAGGFGKMEDGKATSSNFLVRSVSYFTANGFNVAIFGKPSDSEDLDYADRISEPHLTDVRAVLDHVKTLSAAPVWMVGTSRGTVSVAAAAIRVQGDIAGVVLSSSIVNIKKPGALQSQNLAAIKVPVLMFHHSKDACIHCRPDDAAAAFTGFINAPVKKMILVDGGANPTGDVCGAQHWHGYIGMEQEAADAISGWIKSVGN